MVAPGHTHGLHKNVLQLEYQSFNEVRCFWSLEYRWYTMETSPTNVNLIIGRWFSVKRAFISAWHGTACKFSRDQRARLSTKSRIPVVIRHHWREGRKLVRDLNFRRAGTFVGAITDTANLIALCGSVATISKLS